MAGKLTNNNKLILYGHSTGGLLTSLYSNNHRSDKLIKALILNSPFFDFNTPALLKTMIPFISSVSPLITPL